VSSVAYNDGASWALSDFPGYAEASTGFDEYRLIKVTSYFQLMCHPAAVKATPLGDISIQSNLQPIATVTGHNNAMLYPKFWYCHDYNYSGGETLANMVRRQGVKFTILKPDKVFSVVTYPKIASNVQTSGTVTNFANSAQGTWAPVASPAIINFGLLYNVDMHGYSGTNAAFRVEHRAVIEFRSR